MAQVLTYTYIKGVQNNIQKCTPWLKNWQREAHIGKSLHGFYNEAQKFEHAHENQVCDFLLPILCFFNCMVKFLHCVFVGSLRGFKGTRVNVGEKRLMDKV
jgi:hypothetical protein